MKTFLCTLLALSLLTASEAVVLTIDAPTSDFVLVPGNDDPDFDGPNNTESSLVGDGTSGLGSFYIGFDPDTLGSATDGTLYFRLRVSGDINQGNNQLGEFNEYALFGFDVTGDEDIDFYLEVDGSDNAFDPVVTAFDATGGTNNSIFTIGLGNALSGVTLNASTDFSLVSDVDNLTGSNSDLDNSGGTDALLTLSVDFAAIVAAANSTGATAFDDTSAFALIALLDTNGSFNGTNGVGDVSGVDDDNPGTGLFADTGGLSPEIDANGNVVPEPASFAMIVGLLSFSSALLRRQRFR